MKSTIHCTRCGTVTTWTPYCPGCGAYLEFAGDPPWVPEPRSSDSDGAKTDESDDDSASDSSDEDSSDAVDSDSSASAPSGDDDTTEAVPELPPPAPEPAPSPVKPRPPHRRIGGVAPWWRFWDRPKTPTAEEPPPPTPSEPEGPREADATEEDNYTYVVVAPDVPESVPAESPAIQEEVQKRTIPIGRPDDLGVTGGLPCPVCRFRNYVDAAYCARCGYPRARQFLRSGPPELPSLLLRSLPIAPTGHWSHWSG